MPNVMFSLRCKPLSLSLIQKVYGGNVIKRHFFGCINVFVKTVLVSMMIHKENDQHYIYHHRWTRTSQRSVWLSWKNPPYSSDTGDLLLLQFTSALKGRQFKNARDVNISAKVPLKDASTRKFHKRLHRTNEDTKNMVVRGNYVNNVVVIMIVCFKDYNFDCQKCGCRRELCGSSVV